MPECKCAEIIRYVRKLGNRQVLKTRAFAAFVIISHCDLFSILVYKVLFFCNKRTEYLSSVFKGNS